MSGYVQVDHPRFVKAQRDIFIKSVVADCMIHNCRLSNQGDRDKLDACCQYGVDVDLSERDAILERRDEIESLLIERVAQEPWFGTTVSEDSDFPTGRYVRTTTHDNGCIFLAHDRRGCAIHRASLTGGWDFRGVKPHVCRLFPLSYESDAIVLSDDYADYSCASVANAPSVYRVGRDTLADVFGDDLVVALDRTEVDVLGQRSALSVHHS